MALTGIAALLAEAVQEYDLTDLAGPLALAVDTVVHGLGLDASTASLTLQGVIRELDLDQAPATLELDPVQTLVLELDTKQRSLTLDPAERTLEIEETPTDVKELLLYG